MSDKLLFFLFDRRNPRVQSGAGYYYYDTDGKEYLDALSGGTGACVLGHTVPPRIARVLHEQAGKLNFAAPSEFDHDSVDRLLDRLIGLMPQYAAAGLYQSGSDAVEAALRCALQVARARSTSTRKKIIGRRSTYHGLTLGARALGGWDSSLQQQEVPNVLHIEPQNCFSCPFDLEYPSCDMRCASALRRRIEKEGPETIAAFVATPSNGGPVPDEYWPQIRAICDEYQILLVLDDVMEGLWRTGPAVSLTRWRVTPDIVALGKVLGGGIVPISATLVTEAVLNTLRQDGVFLGGHTYSGHILSCEVASAVLEEIEVRELSSVGIASVERNLGAVLGRIGAQFEGSFTGVRGTLGLVHIPCTVPGGDSHAFYLEVKRQLLAQGLIVGAAVRQDYLELGFGPPFIADEKFFDELAVRLARVLENLDLRAPSPEQRLASRNSKPATFRF